MPEEDVTVRQDRLGSHLGSHVRVVGGLFKNRCGVVIGRRFMDGRDDFVICEDVTQTQVSGLSTNNPHKFCTNVF